jgi:F-type H+-transporting ATPase subunit delta
LNAVARRYAGALFDVTEQRGTSVQAQASLSGVRAVIAEHPDLKHVLGSAAVTARQKRAILDAELAKLPPLNQEVARLLTALADRDRLGLIDLVGTQFDDRILDKSRVVNADVVTAVPLGAGQEAALAAALGRAVDRVVRIHARVDSSIVGGVIARVGSLVFDGSVTRQLEKMKTRLAIEA